MSVINNIELFGKHYDLNDARITIEPYSSWTVITINDHFVIAYGKRNLTFPAPTEVGGVYRSIEQLNMRSIMSEVYGGIVGYLNGYSVPSVVPNGTNKYMAEVVFTYNTNFSGFNATVPTVIFGTK